MAAQFMATSFPAPPLARVDGAREDLLADARLAHEQDLGVRARERRQLRRRERERRRHRRHRRERTRRVLAQRHHLDGRDRAEDQHVRTEEDERARRRACVGPSMRRRDVGAVRAAEILDEELLAGHARDARACARDGRVGDRQIVVGRPRAGRSAARRRRSRRVACAATRATLRRCHDLHERQARRLRGCRAACRRWSD